MLFLFIYKPNDINWTPWIDFMYVLLLKTNIIWHTKLIGDLQPISETVF